MVAPAGRWETVADELVDELVEDAPRRSFLGGLQNAGDRRSR
jgi:hypothetical protein